MKIQERFQKVKKKKKKKNLEDGKRSVGNGSLWAPFLTANFSTGPLHPRTSISSHRTAAAALFVRIDPPHPSHLYNSEYPWAPGFVTMDPIERFATVGNRSKLEILLLRSKKRGRTNLAYRETRKPSVP